MFEHAFTFFYLLDWCGGMLRMVSMGARFLLVVGLLILNGCGTESGFPETYPVTGTVKVNDKPVEGAIVTFQLEGGKENAIGTTDSKGEFSLSMFRPGDGAIAGQYRVAISKVEAAAAPTDTPPPGQIASADLPTDYAPPAVTAGSGGGSKKSEIPAKYANDQTSALRATVSEAGPNRFDFNLK